MISKEFAFFMVLLSMAVLNGIVFFITYREFISGRCWKLSRLDLNDYSSGIPRHVFYERGPIRRIVSRETNGE